MANRLTFPSELENEDQFLLMSIHKYYRPQRASKSEKPSLLEIVLPIPNNLVDNSGVAYAQEAIGLAGMFGANLGEGIASGSVQNIKDSLSDIVTSQSVKDSIKYYAAQAAVDFVGNVPGIGDAIKGGFYGAGVARNPYEVQMFKNVNFRAHSFNYKFVPKSLEEQNTVNKIIKMLKFHMLPSYTSETKTYFTYPDVFEMTLKAGSRDVSDDIDNYLFKFKPAVLESVNVNYNPEGSPFYHDTGNGKAPVSLTVDLSFKEMLLPERDDIMKGVLPPEATPEISVQE